MDRTQLTRPGADDDELSVVVAGHGRSTSHARGLLRVNAVALERALAEARAKLAHQTNLVTPGGSA